MDRGGMDWSYRAVLFISRMFGVFPFELYDFCRLRPSRAALVHTVLLHAVSMYTLCKIVLFYNSRLFTYVLCTEIFSVIITTMCSTIWLYFKTERLSEVLATSLAIQRRYGQNPRCMRCLVQMVLGCFAFLFVIIFRYNTLPLRDWNQLAYMISFYMPTFMVFVMVMQFTSTGFLVGDSFTVLTAALLNSPRQHSKLLILLQDHLRLTQAVEAINSCYGLQNLCFFTSSFCNITSNVYMLASFTKGSNFPRIYSIILFPTLIWTIVFVSNETKDKASMFTNVLYQLALDGKSCSLSNNMNVCLHLAFTKEVQFTACDFFVLDFPLICSMVGAATSYLLILVQFSPKEQDTQTEG